MRVAIASYNSQLGHNGGTDVYIRALVEALADYANSCEITVLARARELPAWQFRSWPSHVHFQALLDAEPRLPIIERAVRRFSHRVFLREYPQTYGEPYLARQIDEQGFNLIHCPRTIVYPLFLETSCVLTFFDLQQEYYPEFFTESDLEYRAQAYRASIEKASHLIVPSRFTQSTLMEKYRVAEDRMTILPVGVSEAFHRVNSTAVAEVRSKYNLPDRFIYYPANPWPHKNHARLMAALSIYRRRNGTMPWLVLSGRLKNERRDAMSLAVAAGIEDQVIDLGFIDSGDLPALYSAARLLVFPSLFEGFGIPLVEAMACGCPIAAANATTTAEITNGAAVLFDPLDPEDIFMSIDRALEDEALRKDLIACGYEQAKRFRWPEIIARLLEVYKRVI